MQKVEKKTRRGAGKRIWIAGLAILAAAAVAAAVLTSRDTAVEVPKRENTGGTILQKQPAEIQRMTVTVRGKEPWTAVRDADGGLRMEGGDGWTVDAALGERIEDALANIVYEDILTEDPAEYRDHLAEFGLAEPAIRAEVTYTDGTRIVLNIGDASGLEDADYRFMTVEGDGRLYAVAGSLAQDLQVEQELLHPVVQPQIQTERIDEITILDGKGQVTARWSLMGNITDSDAADNWKVTWPISYPADYDTIVNLKKNAGNLRNGLYVGENTEENRAKTGLSEPRAVIRVHMAAGATGQITSGGAFDIVEREAETVEFVIGGSRNEMTDYALFDDTIYTMNHFTVAALTETDPMKTLARYPVTVPLDSLAGLTIERADAGREVYELTRTTVPAETEGEPARTEVSVLKDGEAMDYAAFSAVYERWLVVTVSGRLPEGWEKKKPERIYTFRTVSGAEHKVELSEYDPMHDAVTVDGETVFYLIKNAFAEIQ